jgi:hypothetical protein
MLVPLALLAVLALPAGFALGATSATPTQPTATTGAPSGVTPTAATLNGTVNPNGLSTTYQFEFGPTVAYGLSTPPASAGAGTGVVAVNRTITGLAPSTTYHYRLSATNSKGTVNGADGTFTTPSLVVGSKAGILAPTAFVSPHGVVGVGAGCFGGSTMCHGTLTLSQGGKVYASRGFNIPAESGGFVHVVLSSAGMTSLFAHTSQPAVLASINTGTGQQVSRVVHLVRFH